MVSHGIAIKILARATVIWRLDLGGGSTSKTLTHVAVGLRSPFLTAWTFLQEAECPYRMTNSFSQSKWSEREPAGSHNPYLT